MKDVSEDQFDVVELSFEQIMQTAMLAVSATMLKMGVTRMTLGDDDIDRASRSFVNATELEDGSWVIEIHSADSEISKSLPPFQVH